MGVLVGISVLLLLLLPDGAWDGMVVKVVVVVGSGAGGGITDGRCDDNSDGAAGGTSSVDGCCVARGDIGDIGGSSVATVGAAVGARI